MTQSSLLNGYPGGQLILSDSLEIIKVTPEFCHQFNCQPQDLLNQPLEELFSPRDRKGSLTFHQKLSQYEQGVLDLVIVLIIKQQQFMTRIRVRKNACQWVAIVEDILQESDDLFRQFYLGQERWKSIVSNSSEGIAMLDKDNKVIEFNSRFLEMLELRSSHGVLLNEEAISHQDFFKLFEHPSAKLIQDYIEKSNHKKSQKLLHDIKYHHSYFKLEITPIYLPVKGFTGCSFVIKDISLQKQLEATMLELHQKNQEIIALNQKLKAENLRMTAELDIARQMQQMILPEKRELEAIEGLDIAGFMYAADEVGGDYYDVLSHEDVVTIGIGDVTGHGLESGILMVMTQTAVRTLQEVRETDPVRFLDTINRTLYQNIQRMKSERNLTLAILNYSQGRVSLSGQHEEMIIVRKGGTIERIDTIDLGFPIGLDEQINEFINHALVELNSGDSIVLYTDGITDAKNCQGCRYGLKRLCQVLQEYWQETAEQIKQAVIDDLWHHIATTKIVDDITLLVLKQE